MSVLVLGPPLLASVGHLLSLHTPRSGTEGTEVEECNGGTEGDRGPAGCVRWEGYDINPEMRSQSDEKRAVIMSYPYHPRVGFSVSRSFPSCFACGHSLLPVQPSPKGEDDGRRDSRQGERP